MMDLRSEMKNVFIAGHKGMVGSALVRQLENKPDTKLVVRNRNQLDLTSQKDVFNFFSTNRIDEVYLAGAKVGGIYANSTYPAEFIYENLSIEANIIHAAHLNNVQKLLFLGSSCIYPKKSRQPMSENVLLDGPLEPTNEPYAIAKIAGIKLCESYNRQYGRDYRSVMPTNLYGPNDNFHPENSHVVPALLKRFYEAARRKNREVVAWGTGTPKREFLHVDDMASACVHVMNLSPETYQRFTRPTLSHINIGTGQDCSIRELVETIADITGFKGNIIWDKSKPDGAPRKLLDVSLLHSLGWQHTYSLKNGLQNAFEWYVQNQNELDKLNK